MMSDHVATDQWAKDRADELASLTVEKWRYEELHARTSVDIEAALMEAKERGKETGAVEWGLAYQEGYDSILTRLRSSDMTLIKAVATLAFPNMGPVIARVRTMNTIGALVTILESTPQKETKEQP